ncbi:toxin glutamine deamidase domain-containing protein [Micromonospora sp. NPDC092111]|uniref:scabin-related ADP-ribosyltransferase n=1 Tax=Micromonospora sp. NPDC092111 TaxID=3364289 RepID=UPI003803CFBC
MVVERLRAESLLDQVSTVADLTRDDSALWRTVPVPPHVRRMYTAVGHHDADGNRPVQFGTGLALRTGEATRPPAPLTVPFTDAQGDPRSSVDLVDTAQWLAETAFDWSRSAGGQRPPVVRVGGSGARSALVTRQALRGLVAENLRGLGLGPADAERLTGRIVIAGAATTTVDSGPVEHAIVEVSQDGTPPVAGFGRTASAADPPADVDPEQVALALFRGAVRHELTARRMTPTRPGGDRLATDRARAQAARAHRLDPVDRLLLTETVRESGSHIAAGHAALLALHTVETSSPADGHTLAVPELHATVDALPPRDTVDPDGTQTLTDRLAAVAALITALHDSEAVPGSTVDRLPLTEQALTAAATSGGWTRVESLAALARDVARPTRADGPAANEPGVARQDAPGANGPRLALVVLRTPDGHSDHALTMVATTTGVRWVDPLRRRVYHAGEIPAEVNGAVSAEALLIDTDGHIRQPADGTWPATEPTDGTPTPPDPTPRHEVAAPLGGGVLRILDDLADNAEPADRDHIIAARQFGYEVAAHLVAARTGTTHPAEEIPTHTADDPSVATTVELMALLHVQLSAVLARQANPGGPATSDTAVLTRQPMLSQWEAAGHDLQDFFVQHVTVIRNLFTDSFNARYPDFANDLRAERGLPDDTEVDLWAVPLLDEHTGLPAATTGQFISELLHPDPTAPRINPGMLGITSPDDQTGPNPAHGSGDPNHLLLQIRQPTPQQARDHHTGDPAAMAGREGGTGRPATAEEPVTRPAGPAAAPAAQGWEADGDSFLLLAERLRPLQEYLGGLSEADPRPTVDLVVMAASGSVDRVWVEVRVPDRVEPVSLGPADSGLLDSSLRVAASIRINAEQLTNAVVFSFENWELWARSLQEGSSEFVRRFARAAVGHRITDAPREASVGEFVAAMAAHSSRTWSDAPDPVTALARTDAAALASATTLLTENAGEAAVSAARTWARYQVALDHQRPMLAGHVTVTQRAQLAFLDSLATLVAARYLDQSEDAARDLSRRLGQTYGTLSGFTLLAPPAPESGLPRPRPQEPIARFIELARPLREHAEQQEANPASDIELVLMAAPSRLLAADAVFSPGHAVVAFRLPNGRQVALGFYPHEGLFGAQGIINNDDRYLLARHARVLAVHHINARQLADAYLFAAHGSAENYHLLNSNCVVFATRLVATALGRDVVGPTITTPDQLIAALSGESSWAWADSTSSERVDLAPADQEQLDSARRYLDRLGERTQVYDDVLAWARFRVTIDHQRPLVTHQPTPRQESQFALLDGFATMMAAELHANGTDAAAALSRALGHAYGTLRQPTPPGTAAAYEIEEPDLASPRLPEEQPPVQGGPRARNRPSSLSLTSGVDHPPVDDVLFSAGSAFRSPTENPSHSVPGGATQAVPFLPQARFGTDRRPTSDGPTSFGTASEVPLGGSGRGFGSGVGSLGSEPTGDPTRSDPSGPGSTGAGGPEASQGRRTAGQRARDLFGAAPFERSPEGHSDPSRWDRDSLAALVDDVLDAVREHGDAGEWSLAECVVLARTFVRRIHPGISPGRTSDDLPAGRGGVAGVQDRLVAGAGWARVGDRGNLRRLFDRLGPGATVVFLDLRGDGRTGHVRTWQATGDGRWGVDPQRNIGRVYPLADAAAAGFDDDAANPAGRLDGPDGRTGVMETWALVIDDQGRVVDPGQLSPEDSWALLESDSTAAGLTDAPTNHEFGKYGPEEENHAVVLGEMVRKGEVLLRTADGVVQVVADVAGWWWVGDRYYGNLNGIPAGAPRQLRLIPIPETVVINPSVILAGEDGSRRADADRHRTTIRNILNNSRGETLSELFNDPAFTVSPRYRDLTVTAHPSVFPRGDYLYTQANLGMPLNAVGLVLDAAIAETRVPPAPGVVVRGELEMRPLLAAGQRFGMEVARMYLASLGRGADDAEDVPMLAALDSDVGMLYGNLSLALGQSGVIPLWYRRRRGQMHVKGFLAAASRTSLAAVRAGMPRHLRNFLSRNRDQIQEHAADALANAFPTLARDININEQRQPDFAFRPLVDVTVPIGGVIGNLSGARYLDQLLLGNEPEITPLSIFGVGGPHQLDQRPAPLQPEVVVELRSLGAGNQTPEEYDGIEERLIAAAQRADRISQYTAALAATRTGRAIVDSVRAAVAVAPPERGPRIADVRNAVATHLRDHPGDRPQVAESLALAEQRLGPLVPPSPPYDMGQPAYGGPISSGGYRDGSGRDGSSSRFGVGGSGQRGQGAPPYGTGHRVGGQASDHTEERRQRRPTPYATAPATSSAAPSGGVPSQYPSSPPTSGAPQQEQGQRQGQRYPRQGQYPPPGSGSSGYGFGRLGSGLTDDPAMVEVPTPSDLDEVSVHSVFGWLDFVNSDSEVQFATNCVLAVQATDMALRDPDPTALYLAPPDEPQPELHLVRMQQQLLGLGEHEARAWAVRDIGVIRDAMLAAEDGARGVVVVHRPDAELGHAVNVVRHEINGRPAVSFLDGQTRSLARLPRDPVLRFLPLTPDIVLGPGAEPVPTDVLARITSGDLAGLEDSQPPAPDPARPSAQLDPSVNPLLVTGLRPNTDNPSGLPQFRSDNNMLYRDDTRLPVDFDGNPGNNPAYPPNGPGIFTTGFAPLDPSMTNLPQFVDGEPGAFVSTTRRQDLNFLGPPTRTRPRVFRYYIQAPGGIDVNATLGSHADQGQQEVVFPGGIRPENILGVEQVIEGTSSFMPVRTGPFRPNPNFNPEAPNPHFPTQPVEAAGSAESAWFDDESDESDGSRSVTPPPAAVVGRSARPGGSVRPEESAWFDDETETETDEAVRAAYPWLRSVNPDLSVTNCVVAAITTDMNLVPGEELAWQAPAGGTESDSHLFPYQRDLLGLPETESLVYRTDLDSVLAAMRAAEVGARGILLVRHRAPEPTGPRQGARVWTSHAFNVVRDEHGVVLLDGQRGGVARVPEAPQELVFFPLTHGIDAPTNSERVDPTRWEAGEAGLGGRETEVHSGYLQFPEDVDARGVPWLARHEGTGVVAVSDRGTFRFLHNREVWQDVPGLTEEQVRRTEILPILEFVDTAPFAMLPGEVGMNRWWAAEALRRATNRLTFYSQHALQEGRQARGVNLSEVLRPDAGWTLHPQAQRASFMPVHPGNVADLYAHMSFGARLRALRDIIVEVADLTWLPNPQADARWAVEFAEEIVQGLVTRVALAPGDVRDIEGLLALAAMQVTGAVLATTVRSAGKHHVALVSRHPLWRIRRELSPAASRAVHDFAPWIRDMFELRFLDQYPDFDERYRAHTGRQGGPPVTPLSVAGAHDYLNNALLRTGAVPQSQGSMLGVGTHFDELAEGMIVLEARAPGSRFMNLGELEQVYSRIERIVQNAHVEAAALSSRPLQGAAPAGPSSGGGFLLGPPTPAAGGLPTPGLVPIGTGGVRLPLVSRLVRGEDDAWFADGAEVLWRRVPEARDGWALLTDHELGQLAGRRLLEAGRSVPLLVHPAGRFVRVPVRLPDGALREVLLTPEQLARMLATLLPAGADVALLSCAAGALPDGFARRLAEAGGWQVLAPVADLFVDLPDERAELLTVGGESWLIFTPDGEPWDVINDEVRDAVNGEPFDTGVPREDVVLRHPFDGISAVPTAPTSGGHETGQVAPPPEAAGTPTALADPPRAIGSLLDVARRLPPGSAYRDSTQALVDFLDAHFMEIRYPGQPPMEGTAVADWFSEAVEGRADGVIRPDSWRRVEVALQLADDSGFVVALPDDNHAPAVLSYGEDGQIWQISFTPDGPVPEQLATNGVTPPRGIMIFNKCSEVLLLPG